MCRRLRPFLVPVGGVAYFVLFLHMSGFGWVASLLVACAAAAALVAYAIGLSLVEHWRRAAWIAQEETRAILEGLWTIQRIERRNARVRYYEIPWPFGYWPHRWPWARIREVYLVDEDVPPGALIVRPPKRRRERP